MTFQSSSSAGGGPHARIPPHGEGGHWRGESMRGDSQKEVGASALYVSVVSFRRSVARFGVCVIRCTQARGLWFFGFAPFCFFVGFQADSRRCFWFWH